MESWLRSAAMQYPQAASGGASQGDPAAPPPRPRPTPPRRQRVLPGGGGRTAAEAGQEEDVPIERIERGRGGKPHEYPALPGDLHPAQTSKAIRCAWQVGLEHQPGFVRQCSANS